MTKLSSLNIKIVNAAIMKTILIKYTENILVNSYTYYAIFIHFIIYFYYKSFTI
jgi:hypothetical protein